MIDRIVKARGKPPNYTDQQIHDRLLLAAMKMNEPEHYRRLMAVRNETLWKICEIENRLLKAESEYEHTDI